MILIKRKTNYQILILLSNTHQKKTNRAPDTTYDFDKINNSTEIVPKTDDFDKIQNIKSKEVPDDFDKKIDPKTPSNPFIQQLSNEQPKQDHSDKNSLQHNIKENNDDDIFDFSEEPNEDFFEQTTKAPDIFGKGNNNPIPTNNKKTKKRSEIKTVLGDIWKKFKN